VNERQDLQFEYRSDALCLFVGAGVSISCGLPDWRGLAESVVRALPRRPAPPLGSIASARRKGVAPPPDPNVLAIPTEQVLAQEDPLFSMRFVRADPEIDLAALVRGCLYSRAIALSETAREIPMLANVTRICCYNYDDVLDRAFDDRDRSYRALFEGDRIPLQSLETLVFYPHGYLPDPSRSSQATTERIVLSEDDYFDLYGSPYAWANLVQLTLLLNYTALFVGCSLLDPNTRRLLAIAAKMGRGQRHFAVFRDEYFDDDAPWYTRDYGSAFRSVQDRLLDGLGVRPLWVQDYREVADVLRDLRS
jgi:hypothetical protein